ncbi:universal stress protein, partial [Citrobacter freundii]
NEMTESAEKNFPAYSHLPSHKPGFSTYLLGSTAAAVVRHAKCPVLVVR